MGMKRGDFEVVEAGPAPPSETSPAAPAEGTAVAASTPKEAAAKPEPRAKQPMAPRAAQLARYTVVRGDTWEGIALKLYRNGARWREIAAANAGVDLRRLRPGQILRLPETATPNMSHKGR